MKNTLLISFILLLSACGVVLKNARELYSESTPTVYTNLDSAIASPKQQLMVMVFYEHESALYKEPLTRLLQFDSTKEDAIVYRSMCNDYAIVKLYRNQFDSIMNDLSRYETVDSLREHGLAYNPGKAFMFVCHPKMLYLYGAQTLDTPKPYLHAVIMDFMGP